jgi:plasmid stability protein
MTLILELPDNKGAALKVKAQEQGLSVEQYAAQVLDRNLEETASAAPGKPTRRISERIAEIMSDVPAEEFAKLPKDGARQVDHYVYGLPKRD